jgi:hypothetical protein
MPDKLHGQNLCTTRRKTEIGYSSNNSSARDNASCCADARVGPLPVPLTAYCFTVYNWFFNQIIISKNQGKTRECNQSNNHTWLAQTSSKDVWWLKRSGTGIEV